MAERVLETYPKVKAVDVTSLLANVTIRAQGKAGQAPVVRGPAKLIAQVEIKAERHKGGHRLRLVCGAPGGQRAYTGTAMAEVTAGQPVKLSMPSAKITLEMSAEDGAFVLH